MSSASAPPVAATIDQQHDASATPGESTSRRATGMLALLGAVAILALSLSAFVVGSDQTATNGALPAADFSLRNVDDERITLSQLIADQPVLLIFARGSEAVEAPGLAGALEQDDPLRLVTVQADGGATTLAQSLANFGNTDVAVLADPGRSVALAYGVASADLPYAVLIDPAGTIRQRGPLATCLATLVR